MISNEEALGGEMESIMKKLLLILIILGSFLLSSCSKSSSIGTVSNDLSTDNTNVTHTNSSKNIQISPSGVTRIPNSENDLSAPNVKPTSAPLDHQELTPMQTLKAVIRNETPFLCTDKAPYNSIGKQWNGYLNELTFNNSPMITPQFAVVDLDGDGVSEIVLAIDNYYGFVILRYKEEKVYGNIVSYRTMESLKMDGSFMASSGSSDNSIGKMLFIGDTFFCDEKICSVGGSPTPSYYIHDMPIDKDTWDKCLISFEDLPDVEWHDYSIEAVNQWLIDNPDSSEMSALPKLATADRQNDLDSLAYLIDLTYSNLKSQEEINTNARSFYNGCNDEMNKFYRLCSEKLSGDELETLSTEQQRWQENFNQRFSGFLSDHLVDSMDDLADQSWYNDFGNMMLKRTLYLLNLYYDDHFYD